MEAAIIILQVIAALISAYLLFFARQKGKNLADRQDLHQLTSIVEDIKKSNGKEIELLKANLDFITSRKLEVFSEEKIALVDFYAQLHTWMWGSLNARLNEYNHTNYLEISEKLVFTREMYNKTNIAFSKVQLLVSDKNLILAGHEAIREVLHLHLFVEDLFLKLKTNLAFEKSAIEMLFDKQFDFKKLPNEIQEFQRQQADDRKNERKEILETYHSKQGGLFNSALKFVYTFQGLATDYLRAP